MASRATRALALLARRSLVRRQLHSGSEKHHPILQSPSPRNGIDSIVPTSSLVVGAVNDRQQGTRSFAEKLLELEVSSTYGNSLEKLSSVSDLRWETLLSRQLRAGHPGSVPRPGDAENAWDIRQTSDQNVVSSEGDRELGFKAPDFLSRYLQWRRYYHLAHHSQSMITENPGLLGVEFDSAASVTGHKGNNSEFSSFHSFPSASFLHREEMGIIPLEASSVKRKRKKKMNKHKHRKLRRRERHKT